MSPSIKGVETDHEPMDRLTRMCAAMTDVFDAHPEHMEGDRCIIFLDDGDMGGIEIHGYDGVMDAFVDLFMHVKAMLTSVGRDMQLVMMNEYGEVDL